MNILFITIFYRIPYQYIDLIIIFLLGAKHLKVEFDT